MMKKGTVVSWLITCLVAATVTFGLLYYYDYDNVCFDDTVVSIDPYDMKSMIFNNKIIHLVEHKYTEVNTNGLTSYQKAKLRGEMSHIMSDIKMDCNTHCISTVRKNLLYKRVFFSKQVDDVKFGSPHCQDPDSELEGVWFAGEDSAIPVALIKVPSASNKPMVVNYYIPEQTADEINGGDTIQVDGFVMNCIINEKKHWLSDNEYVAIVDIVHPDLVDKFMKYYYYGHEPASIF